MASLKSSSLFWEKKAKENPYWYVSSFGPYADRALDDFWASGERIWEELKRTLGYVASPHHTIVEVGCGIGRLTRVIGPEVGVVHAFDISQEMLRQAEPNAPPNAQLHLTVGDTLNPFPDAGADLVLAYCVFQHLPSETVLATYLREMVRVARPEALVAFTTAPRDWRSRLLPAARLKALMTSFLQRSGPRELYKKEWVGIRPSRKRVERLCPVPLQFAALPGERWLFWGRKADPAA